MTVPVEVRISDGSFLRGEGEYDEKSHVVTLSTQLIAGIAVKLAGVRGIGVTVVAVINRKREPLRSHGSVWLANPQQEVVEPVAKPSAKPSAASDDSLEKAKLSGSIKWMW